MRHICAFALIFVLAAAGVPLSAAGQAEGTGRVSGTARTAKGGALSNYRARIRNTTTGQVSGDSKTDARGGFYFQGLNPGSYVVEFVSQEGIVVATSASIPLAVGSMTVTGLTVTASAAVVAGTAGTLAAAATGGGFFGSNTGILAIGVAAGAGVLGVAKIAKNASPSK